MSVALPDPRPRTILLEGWRRLPHSYALVMSSTLLELAKRPGLTLYFAERPVPDPRWRPVAGLFSPEDEAVIDGVAPPPPGLKPDAVYRAEFPYRLAEDGPGPTCVFATSEHGTVDPAAVAGHLTVAEALRRSTVRVLAPSNAARKGFLAAGAPPARVSVHPHGIDPRVHRPLDPAERSAARAALGWGPDEFVFLHVSALTPNKNVPGMVRAMTDVAGRHAAARLVLKGVDGLYSSRTLLTEATSGLPSRDQATIRDRVTYLGGSVPALEVVRMYQAADAYLAPYTAEGFCLPVLEAAACGLPVICTAGGPTDDFTTPEFALPVRSQARRQRDGPWVLIPDHAMLVQQMRRVIEDAAFRASAARHGPAHTHARYAWSRVVDQLLAFLFRAPA